MTLTQGLADLQSRLRSQIPADKLAIMDQATVDLAQSDLTETTLRVGMGAPTFTLPNALGNPVNLQDLLAQGAVVLAFYRGGWCPYCNLELQALQQSLPQIKALGATLVAISPQTPDHSLSTAEKNELAFEVLSDAGNHVARQFGLVFTVPETLRSVYKGFGVDLPTYNGDQSFELPVPGTFILDPKGVVHHAFVNPDYTTRMDPVEILAALKTLHAHV